MSKQAYQNRFMPKVILSGSFDFEDDEVMAHIVDDSDVLRKCASSKVVSEWGEIQPKKNASMIHLIAMGAHETTGCFFAGARVQTISGLKPIEEIKVGDLVLTHQNRFKPVLATFESPYDGERTSIKISGIPELEVATGNHPYWVVRAKHFTAEHRRERTLAKRGKVKDNVIDEAIEKAEFISASDIKIGDFMVIPVAPVADGAEVFSAEQARMFGYYLGGGCIARETRQNRSAYGLPKEAVFTLSESKRGIVDDIKKITKAWLDRDLTENPSSSSEPGIRLSVSNKDFAAKVSSLMGCLAAKKFLSPVLFQQSEEWTLQFLASYFDCDGCLTTDSKEPRNENVLKVSTASLNLSLDTQRLLASVRIPSSISKCHNLVKNGCFGKEDGVIYSVSIGGAFSAKIAAHCRRLKIANHIQKNAQSSLHTNGKYALVPVTAIATDWVENEVKFNLEVEGDNTYVTAVIGHNSNRNGDSWRANFLKEAHPTFKEHGALYRNHKNKDYSKREGDVEKTAYNDDMGRVELLVSANHDKCADWLGEIEKGNRINVSMGFDCEYDVCSICNHEAPTRKQYCEHVKKNASAPYGMGKILPDGRKCFIFNPRGVFNDISQVPVGADMIAQHLRKVAGLDEEIIGGAELAETLFPDLGREKCAAKIAVATKLSRMEKLVPASARRLDADDMKVPEKTASALREMPVSKMFGELAKLGCLLPLRSFFDLIMGEKVAELEPHIAEAEKSAHRVFDFITSSDAIMDEVCANGAFECAAVPISKLGTADSRDLIIDFNMEPSLAGDRMIKNAICSSRTIELADPTSISPSAQELLKQYASYKIAALESGAFNLSDDLFYVAAGTC